MVVGKVVEGWIDVKKGNEIEDLRERFSCISKSREYQYDG